MVKMILDYLKFIVQKLISSKYVRKGKCNCCGNCCRNVLLYSKKNLPIVNENQFKQVQKFSLDRVSALGQSQATWIHRIQRRFPYNRCREP